MDLYTGMVAAKCWKRSAGELLCDSHQDDEHSTIARYRKRYRREGWFMTYHMYQKGTGVDPDNSGVERVNRRFVAVRSNGGGNHAQRGMDSNSVLFTISATDWINGKSLFEHLMRSTSGDRWRVDHMPVPKKQHHTMVHARTPTRIN